MEKIRARKCQICGKDYPADATLCIDDRVELVPLFEDPLIGTIFADKYEILSLLGEGGMSKVYKARHTFMKRTVAVKLLHESASSDLVATARFQLEAEAASALSHPNVVTVHDYGLTPDGRAFFIMDCLEGESLAEVLEKNKHLRLQEALEIFTQTCEGLDHAHRKNIIHCDVKPSNLVIVKQEDGHDLIKLVDFGIAKLIKKLPDEEKKYKQQITQTGEIFGTPAYMSPEQCCGRPLDARSDIYSFGCLMYESLAGEPPLLGETFVDTAVKHCNEKPKPLSETALVKVPADLELVIMRCMEKDPKKRYASAAELKQALYDAAYVAGLKGLRVGAVPELRSPMGTSANAIASKISITTRYKNKSKNTLIISVSSISALLLGLSWYVFWFQGPAGDEGTLFDKLRWQYGIAFADDLMKKGAYGEAAETLERCEDVARIFGDENRRLETTLQKQVEAYGRNHDAINLEQTNNMLVGLANHRVYQEFELLMKLLKEWEQPLVSSVQREERAREIVAFGERISRCADKLSVRSRLKQEALLKRAVKAFDLLNLQEGIYRSRFRLQLAEIYKLQNRLEEQKNILAEAVLHAPETPQTSVGWTLKIQAKLLFGVLNCNRGNLETAREELEHALKWSREHLGEGEMFRDCLNATAELYRKYGTEAYKARAVALTLEAKKISDKLDADEDKEQ